MSKYSKSPWKIITWNMTYPTQEIRIYSDDGLIATMNGTKDSVTNKMDITLPQEANAQLISAAPDMYEALKAIIAKRTECHESETAYIPPEIELAYKAISKAEGR
jgi:hypothetical protein